MTPEQKLEALKLLLETVKDWYQVAEESTPYIPHSAIQALHILFPKGI